MDNDDLNITPRTDTSEFSYAKLVIPLNHRDRQAPSGKARGLALPLEASGYIPSSKRIFAVYLKGNR